MTSLFQSLLIGIEMLHVISFPTTSMYTSSIPKYLVQPTSIFFPGHATMAHEHIMHASHKSHCFCTLCMQAPHHQFVHVTHKLFLALNFLLTMYVLVTCTHMQFTFTFLLEMPFFELQFIFFSLYSLRLGV